MYEDTHDRLSKTSSFFILFFLLALLSLTMYIISSMVGTIARASSFIYVFTQLSFYERGASCGLVSLHPLAILPFDGCVVYTQYNSNLLSSVDELF